jgi:beta-glucanase (GH16 family)
MGLFGAMQATSQIEAEEAALIKDYNDFLAYGKSEELKRVEELDRLVKSGEFIRKVKEIKARKFRDTEQYRKEQEYFALKKSKDIKGYFRLKGSSELSEYKETGKSAELEKYNELDAYLKTREFLDARLSGKKQFKISEAFQKQRQFKDLKNSTRLRKYFKLKASQKMKTYIQVKGSDRLKRLEELEQYLNTDEFRKVKDYMALKPKQKYEQSDEYKLEQEYQALMRSEKLMWFRKLQKKNEFDKLKQWELTFEDDFTEGMLDSKKWMTNYFWGETLLKDTYALPGDKHFYTRGKNIEIADSVLKIITRKETASGKVWNPLQGFLTKDFDYTSGLISTGNSFRQKYGKVRAKIRMSHAPVRQAMWMVAEKILPHVDVAKMENGKLYYGNFWGNIAEKGGVNKKIGKKAAEKYTGDYFIYSLEWTPEKLVWKINNKPVLTQTRGVPSDPMYLVISAGVTNGVTEHQLPAKMEIDWVKIYQKAEQ